MGSHWEIVHALLRDLNGAQVAFLVTATILGAAFRGFTGFGAGLFLVPTYSVFLLPSEAIVLVSLLNLPTTLQILPKVWRDVPWRRVGVLNMVAAATIPLGVWLLVLVDSDALARVIGGLVIALSLLLMSGWRYRGHQAVPQDLAVGFVAGLLSGATGMGGPPVVLYFLSGTTPANIIRAAFIFSFSCITIVTLVSLVTAGLVARFDIMRFLILLPVYFLGTWLGNRLFLRTKGHDGLFRALALWSLIVVGIIALAN